MDKRIKRILSGGLATLLCVSMNLNPIGVIAKEIVKSEFVQDLGVLYDNILYVANQPDAFKVKADEITNNYYEENYYHDCDHSGVEDAINGAKNQLSADVNNAESAIINNGNISIANTTNIVSAISIASGQITDSITKNADRIMKNDDKNTALIIEAIEQAQHQYKVANLYSVNNTTGSCLWRPTLDELPPIDALMYATVGYAGVYLGYWDAGVATDTNRSSYLGRLGIPEISKPNSGVSRACEVLGYDILVRCEGYSGNAGTGTHVQTLINENAVTWGDAVQVIYKALGQYEYSYSYYTAPDYITPETSPLSQSLSNITTFDATEGAYHLFVSRSDQYTGSDLKTVNPIYWTKALNDALVQKDNYDKKINWTEFVLLCENMMHLYGEPVMNETEMNALLQVYGLEYPIQMGVELADAWAYLKARGVLNVDDISWTGSVSREDLLNVAMCIGDKNSRTNYKEIQLTINLSDAMKADGYYPVKNLKTTTGGFTVTTEFDYRGTDYYDYFILISDKAIGQYVDANGKSHDLKTNFNLATGAKMTNILVSCIGQDGSKSTGTYCGTFTDSKGNVYYHVQAPKDFVGTLRLDSTNRDDLPRYIDIDKSNLGGGIYTSFMVDVYAGGYGEDTTIDTSAIMATESSHKLFNSLDSEEWTTFVDHQRAEGINPEVAYLKPNASLMETVSYAWNKWTTPMEVKAYTIQQEGTDITIQLEKDVEVGGELIDEMDWEAKEANNIYSFISRYLVIMSDDAICKAMTDDAGVIGNEELFKNYIKAMSDYMFLPVDQRDPSSLGDFEQFAQSPTFYMILNASMPYACDKIVSNRIDNSSLDKFNASTYPLATGDLTKQQVDALLTQAPMLWSFVNSNYEYDSMEWKSGKLVIKNAQATVQEITDIIGNVTKYTAEGKIILDTSEDVITGELDMTVHDSAVMDRNEQILLSWTDLLKTGCVTDTFNGGTPVPANDGIYYIQTVQGQVKINPALYTIAIGTTFYNLAESDGTGPKLVYTDGDTKEVYLDYRCVMGIMSQGVSREGTKVTSSDNSLGSGTTVVYNISKVGAESSLTNIVNVAASNYPNIASANTSNYEMFSMQFISDTTYDNKVYHNQATNSDFTYWGGDKSNMVRIALSSFCPTANWITVIDRSPSGVDAGLFVWYPRSAFQENKNITIDDLKGIDNYNIDTTWNSSTTFGEGKTVKQAFDPCGYDENVWYDKMTMEAVSKLFLMTNGAYILNKEYVVRYFDITNNSAADCYNIKGEQMTGNDMGAVYWLEGIGFVYNCPVISEYNHEQYLEGLLPLPTFLDNSSGLAGAKIYVCNPDHYKTLNGYSSTYSGYGYCYANDAIWDVRKIADGNKGFVEMCTNESVTGKVEHEPYKFTEMIYAPVATYAFFGGANNRFIGSSQITRAILDQNFCYLGSQKITYYERSDASTLSVRRGSRNATPFELRGESGEEYTFYEVYYNPKGYRVFVCLGGSFEYISSGGLENVSVQSQYGTDISNLIDKLGLKRTLDTLDEWSSWIILFVFYVCPIIGVILMTVLVGLSFISQNKIVQAFCDKVFDPVKILTLGFKDIHTWPWRKVLIPCICLYAGFALFLNANIVRMLAWCAEWYGTVMELFQQLT